MRSLVAPSSRTTAPDARTWAGGRRHEPTSFDDPVEPEPTAEELADAERDRQAAVDDASRLAAVLVALLVATIPLATGYVLWSTPTGADDWNRRVSMAPFDLVLVAMAGWAILHRGALIDLLRARAVQVVAALYVVCFAVALAVTPSPLGFSLAWRLAAGLAAMAAIGTAWRSSAGRTTVLAAIALAGAAQAVLGMVQAARGEAFAVELIDFAGPLYPFGSSFAGRGGLTHPYHLAVSLVVAQGAALLGLRHAGPALGRRAPWLAALVVLSAGIGVTYTRAGAIGQVALVVAAACGRRDRRPLLLAAAAVVVGLAIGGLAFGDGWMARTATTTGQDGSANPDSSRSERAREAAELISAHPITGVGPGRYVEALTEEPRTEYLPAHNIVLHSSAELGVVGGFAVVSLLALLAFRVLRGGAWTAAVVVPMVPFLLLDAYPYVFATGLAASALWLGLARASLEPAADARDDVDADAAAAVGDDADARGDAGTPPTPSVAAIS